MNQDHLENKEFFMHEKQFKKEADTINGYLKCPNCGVLYPQQHEKDHIRQRGYCQKCHIVMISKEQEK